MISIWTNDMNLPDFPALEGDLNTDVLIVGGGMAGILCAYFLQKKGVDYILAEGRTICGGVTKDTTAKITSQHGLLYDKLLEKTGRETAGKYLKANQMALEQYWEICRQHSISCNMERKSAFVYSLSDRLAIEREVKAVQSLGFPARFREDSGLPFPVAGAVEFPDQAQFHPLEFVQAIAGKLHILEHTFVKRIEEHSIAVTDRGRIRAKSIIIAAHFPFLDKHGSYFLKMYQRRSYVLALKTEWKAEGMYLEDKQDGMSLRNHKEYLLIGGGGHRTGKKGGNWQLLREFAKQYFPDGKEAFYWAAQDCMTLDGLPYIGRYSKHTPGLYVATGFQKWGMTTSLVSAMLLSELVTGNESEYEDIFSPSRSMLHRQLLVNGLEAAANLLTFSKKRCPHLGCALKWNPQENTWDCPCHGSRFTKEGRVINNPANGDLS